MSRRFTNISAPRPKLWTSVDTIIVAVATFIVLVALTFALALATNVHAYDSWINRQGLHNAAGK